MLFFKPRQRYDEILPPPPPSDMELEEALKEKPKFFDELTDNNKEDVHDTEFGALDENMSDAPESYKKKPKELLEAEEEIKNASSMIQEKEKPNFFRGLFGRMPKKEQNEGAFAVQDVSKEDAPHAAIDSIREKIGIANGLLDKSDTRAAKEKYIGIMRDYNNLNAQEQSEVYNDISNLYIRRKSAEK